MASTLVRVREEDQKILKQLATQENLSLQDTISHAAKLLRRKLFWDKYESDMNALKADPKAWAEYQAESKAWLDAPLGTPKAKIKRVVATSSSSTSAKKRQATSKRAAGRW